MDEDELGDTQPGEKGPPASEERTGDDEAPMPDEPPDSSSEVGQVMGLPPGPPPDGEGGENEGTDDAGD